MSSSLVEPGVPLAVLCVVMVLLAALVYRVSAIGRVWTVPSAAGRGFLQLAAVSLVLAAALAHLWSSLLVLVVMFAAAAFTSIRRSEAGRSGLWLTVPLAVGIGVVVPLCLSTGVVPAEGIAIVPVGGIILGGTMTATSLAARRALDALSERHGEVEAALSLGLTERDSRLEVVRPTAGDALLPGLDQTRTVGLVTLPGAFVGVLLASGSAIQAGAVQILVLTGLLLAQTLAVVLTVDLVSRGVVHRKS
ncbi:ABC transporter permease [Rhodococcus sp. RS1C4]|uniref:ABC transporter permease n=1 Tax=Nocardiaceae TaxID=85025 RepID=UPI0005230149|nr:MULTISPECIES: ABC transporter permease [Rhodococcus]OZC55133.1 ABC transporter permease [Rhodococcus sp. 06-621-2]OZC57829.1 ABC transporter permease [Rhodococcus sp. RS1C4]OZC88409.1 ABC transporter permease [Rhodococcus sp. 06-418-1B]OZD11952.1 ABC transporter permease [Rhodococcus sp. 06-156-4C]OZD23617.1 ABC transporter permease [Rhodococcus sp. 06-156-4a]